MSKGAHAMSVLGSPQEARAAPRRSCAGLWALLRGKAAFQEELARQLQGDQRVLRRGYTIDLSMSMLIIALTAPLTNAYRPQITGMYAMSA